MRLKLICEDMSFELVKSSFKYVHVVTYQMRRDEESKLIRCNGQISFFLLGVLVRGQGRQGKS